MDTHVQEERMVDFSEFQADTPQNNRVMQMSLREIDTDVLAAALTGFTDELRQMVYRNVSRRVAGLCKGAVKAKTDNISKTQVNAAQEVFIQLLNRNLKSVEGLKFDRGEGNLPEIALDSEEEVISTFKSLADYVRKHGVLPLEGLENSIKNPLMKKGIEFLVDGYEPLLMRSILERHRDSYLQSVKLRLDMILDGIDSLASQHYPEGVEEILKGYIQKASRLQ